MEVTFKVDAKQLLAMIEHGDRDARLSAARVLSVQASKLWTKTRRDVAAAIGVSTRYLSKRGRIHRASANELEARLSVYTSPLNPVRFGATQDKSKGGGVSAAGRSWPGAFLAFGKFAKAESYKLVFRRRGTARLPLDVMKIPWQAEADAGLVRNLPAIATDISEDVWKDLEWRLSRV